MSDIQLFVEEVLRLEEATALEIFNSVYKGKQPLSAEAYLKILESDPTATIGIGIDTENTLENSKKGKFTDWIVKQYFKSPNKTRFLDEDAAGIKDALNLYIKATKNKESMAKLVQAIQTAGITVKNPGDINTYDRQALLTAVAPLRGEVSLGAKAETQIKVLLDDAYWQVVIPLTHAASRKYGTDTHWCTATETPDHYKRYTKDGPLIIIKSKKLEALHDKRINYKWQYHQPSNQFKNQADRGVGYFSFVDQFLTSTDPNEIESTKKLIDALLAIYPMDVAKWDYTRVLDKMKYDYNVVNTALAKATSPLTAKVSSGRTEQGEEVSILMYAVHAKNLDLLNDILNLEDVIWPTTTLTNVLGSVLRQQDSVMFGNVLRDIKDKPMALSADKGRGITLLAECMIEGPYWMNEALQSLDNDKERRQVLLLSNWYGTPFMQAIVKGGKAAEDNLIECAQLITTFFPIQKIQEALVYSRPTVANYFLIKTSDRREEQNAIQAAEQAGLLKLAKYLKELSGIQIKAEITLASEQGVKAYLKEKQYEAQPKAEITQLTRWGGKEPQPIPLPSFLGFVKILAYFNAKSNLKMIKDYFNYILLNHKDLYIQNTEATKSRGKEIKEQLLAILEDEVVNNIIGRDPQIAEAVVSGFIENLALTKQTFLTIFFSIRDSDHINAMCQLVEPDSKSFLFAFLEKLKIAPEAILRTIYKKAMDADWQTNKGREAKGIIRWVDSAKRVLVTDEYSPYVSGRDSIIIKVNYEKFQDILFSLFETNEQVDTFVKAIKTVISYSLISYSYISGAAKKSLAVKGKAWRKAHPQD